MALVTVSYFNSRLQCQEVREHTLPDLTQCSLQAAVDLFVAEAGPVLSIWAEDRCLHRSGIQLSDLQERR